MKIEVYSPTIRRKEMDAVLTALVEDKIGPGEQARLLIQIAREKLGFDFCLALRSPAAALFLTLKSLGLKEGEGVIISALSPCFYFYVLDDLKLKPLYADVESFSEGVSVPCMSRKTIQKVLDSKPEGLDVRAVILHHTLGYLPDSAAIAELGMPLVEDCSQSFGGVGRTAKVDGNTPSFSILGLEERDMLTAGSGALLYTLSRKDAPVLRSIGDLPPEYGLPDMNAAMGIVQFREAKKNLDRRAEIVRIYAQAARRTRHRYFVQEVSPQSDTTTMNQDGGDQGAADSGSEGYNNYAFPLILETGMKEVKAYARRKEIIVESAFDNTIMGSGMIPVEQCPEAYSLSLRTVLFPLYPRLRSEEIEKVSKLIATLP